ncbi:MAG: carboxypeptidase-like regulatory domain-containing protein, partial [Blastocatellia bacterium]
MIVKKDFVRKFFAALLICISVCMPATAQSTFGTITGTVTDPTGAVIPNATVLLTNKNTQAVRS